MRQTGWPGPLRASSGRTYATTPPGIRCSHRRRPRGTSMVRPAAPWGCPRVRAVGLSLLRTDHLVIDDVRAGHHGAGSLLKQVVERLALRLAKGAEHLVLDRYQRDL